MKQLFAAALATCALTGPLGAHPHVFVDTTLEFKQDRQGNVVEVEVTWIYDDFFSLLILEDLGLDTDGDGQLTEREFQQLWAFDLKNWYPGFEGDLFINRANGARVKLGKPSATRIDIDDKGRIVAGHRRSVQKVNPVGMYVHQYDPTFYVAYSISGGVHFETGCTGNVSEADLDAASTAREKALAESLAEESEDIFETVELGIYYADRIKVTCSDLS